MVSIERVGDVIKFSFNGNPLYLNDGVISAPLNSLTLVTDNSGIATFKKSATNDIFVCVSYDELGMSKSELETWFKNNAVGGGGTPSGDVQTMIDQSISGMADNASYDSVSQEIKFYNGNTEVYSVDASDFVIDGMIEDVRIETISGVTYLVIDFNTASGKEDIQIPLTDIFDPSNYYTKTEVDQAISGFAESSAVTQEISEAVSGKADTTAVTQAISEATSGKVDSSAVTSSVTSASTDSEIPTAKAVYDAIPTGGTGGGKAISAGTNISVTTGETADTVSCTLPITASTSSNVFIALNNTISGHIQAKVIGNNNTLNTSYGRTYTGGTIIGNSNNLSGLEKASHRISNGFIIGNDNEFRGGNSYILGRNNKATYPVGGGTDMYIVGHDNSATTYNDLENYFFGYSNSIGTNSNSFIIGHNNTVTKNEEFSIGKYNNSVSDGTESGNTFFSIGNGTANNARHNAFEIRQNGDIYITSGGTDIKLQDNLGSVASSAITSGDTNPVQGGAIYNKFDEVEQVTARAIIDVNDKFGGLKLQKITQAAYDALSGNTDSNTLYVITNS